MALEHVPRCQHVKVNGTQCGSPALRRRRHCYFHDRVRHERERIAADVSAKRRFDLPLLEDANSVQMALMKVIQMLGSGQLDHKTAGLMLYALQTASANLRHVDLEVEVVTDIVIDRDTVDATCINGSQWFEEDFEPEAEAEAGNEAHGEGSPEGEQLEVEAGPQKAPEVEEISTQEARRRVQGGRPGLGVGDGGQERRSETKLITIRSGSCRPGDMCGKTLVK